MSKIINSNALDALKKTPGLLLPHLHNLAALLRTERLRSRRTDRARRYAGSVH